MRGGAVSRVIESTCTPSSEPVTGSPGANVTDRRWYGWYWPASFTRLSAFAMLAALDSSRTRLAIMPEVEISREPNMGGVSSGQLSVVSGEISGQWSESFADRRGQKVELVLQQLRRGAEGVGVFDQRLHDAFDVPVVAVVEEEV